MEILTGEQMRNVDRRAIDGMGIPGLDLMEAAGAGIARGLIEEFPERISSGRIVILCGKGNNGGDGLVIARHLRGRGAQVQVVLLCGDDRLRGDAALNLRAAREADVPIREVTDTAAWHEARGLLDDSPLVVDAMLGTGVVGGARGLIRQVIDDLNGMPLDVIAVDLPSGLDADRPIVEGSAVRATRTFTLCRPKLALALEPAASCAGRFSVVPIGIPDEAVRAEKPSLEWLDARAVADLLPPRRADTHKGTYGHLLAVAGGPGKAGAAVLVARRALRCGVVLITVATGASVRAEVAVQQSEMMTAALAEEPGGGLSEAACPVVLELLASRSALAMGPGLGTESGTRSFVRAVTEKRPGAAVLDADGLNAFGAEPPAAGDRPLVLTPHPGEAARLLGCATSEVQADRLRAAGSLAAGTGAVVVLKGHRTLVAHPDGRVAVNGSGNPGMATGGSGDVLTGMIGALLARGLRDFDAARLAVFAHGLAGDLAAERLGQESMIAGDLLEDLPAVWKRIGAERT